MRIVLEHPDFTVVEKPVGTSTHNDSRSVLEQMGPGWHLVHRLDRETSGLLLLTHSGGLQNSLQQALLDGTKLYAAVLRGKWPYSDTQAKWNWPITDKAEGHQNPQGKSSDRKDALTEVSLLKSNDYFSLVNCQLRSGRQHQIRKHSLLAGRPVVGDRRYGNDKDNDRIQKMYGFSRMALHACELRFNWNGEPIQVGSDLPNEFFALFSQSIKSL